MLLSSPFLFFLQGVSSSLAVVSRHVWRYGRLITCIDPLRGALSELVIARTGHRSHCGRLGWGLRGLCRAAVLATSGGLLEERRLAYWVGGARFHGLKLTGNGEGWVGITRNNNIDYERKRNRRKRTNKYIKTLNCRARSRIEISKSRRAMTKSLKQKIQGQTKWENSK